MSSTDICEFLHCIHLNFGKFHSGTCLGHGVRVTCRHDISEPVFPRWNGNFESSALSRYSRFPDGNTGDGENLPREEKTEPGVFAVPKFEDLLLLSGCNADPVILPAYNEAVRGCIPGDPHGRNFSTVAQRVVQQVSKNFFEYRVCIDLNCSEIGNYPDSIWNEFQRYGPIDILPLRLVCPEILVNTGELNLGLDRPRGSFEFLQHLGKSDGDRGFHFCQIKISEQYGSLVQDIVPGNAG